MNWRMTMARGTGLAALASGFLHAQEPAPQPLAVPPPAAGEITTATTAQKPNSSTSASKQFIVYGADLNLRGAFCLLCEDTAASLGRALRDNGQFLLPVVVVLKVPPDITLSGPPVTVNISELTHGGFHLQVNAELRSSFRTSDFTRELVRVLLAERILRSHKKLATTRQGGVLPDWLMTGVTQALEFRSRARPSTLFAAVFRRGQVYSLDRILTADPTQLDALSRGIYETSCCALVLTLLDQPDGAVRFSRFLNALAVEDKPDRELLMQHFPALAASKNALEKWWSLQMASLATPGAFETMNVAETEAALDEALMLMLPTPRPASRPSSTSKEEAAPEEKKSGGFFGWLKRDKPESAPEAEAPKNDDTAPVKPAESKDEEPSPAKKPSNSFFFGGRKIAAPLKPEDDKAGVDGAKPAPAENKPRNYRPWDPRGWGKKDNEEPNTEAAPAKEPPKPEAKTEPAPEATSGKAPEPPTSPEPPRAASAPLRSGSIPLEDFALLAGRKDRAEILRSCVNRLNALKLRAHPLYRPLIGDYTAAVQQVMSGNTKGLSERLETMRARREAIHTQALAIESHLDWYEANHTSSLSGAFDDFLKIDPKTDGNRLPRNDALSRYLDALEKELE